MAKNRKNKVRVFYFIKRSFDTLVSTGFFVLCIPAVSTIVTGTPPNIVSVETRSLVVPGVLLVMLFSKPSILFPSVDFPTFGFPTSVIFMPFVNATPVLNVLFRDEVSSMHFSSLFLIRLLFLCQLKNLLNTSISYSKCDKQNKTLFFIFFIFFVRPPVRFCLLFYCFYRLRTY